MDDTWKTLNSSVLPVGMETCDSVIKGIPAKKYMSLQPHDYPEGIIFFM
jgi:hypothetical protein